MNKSGEHILKNTRKTLGKLFFIFLVIRIFWLFLAFSSQQLSREKTYHYLLIRDTMFQKRKRGNPLYFTHDLKKLK
jgi:hypothetical protein